MSIWLRKKNIIGVDYLRKNDLRLIQSPTLMNLNNGLLRMFFGGRDSNNNSHLFALDLDIASDMSVVNSYKNIFKLGQFGEFDCDSMAPSCIFNFNGETVMLYSAIKLNGLPQYDTSIGLATSFDGINFTKKYKGPILSKGPFDPFGVITPSIIEYKNKYIIYYSSTTSWRHDVKPHPDHSYNIRAATTKDFRQWDFIDKPVINFKNTSETGLIRPWVQYNHKGYYEMWFSKRGPYDITKPDDRKYFIGYAQSKDGINWQRKDEQHHWQNKAEIHEWDYDMQCYQTVIEIDSVHYMFYCGNAYGVGGIGYATRLVDT